MYCDFSLEESSDELILIADGTQLPEDLRDFLFLRDLGVLFAVQRTITPSVKRQWRVDLKMPYSKNLDPYLDIIGDDVQLGYSEPACFTRAFKRWTGTSPKQYRKP